ncbi:MAG TPA: DUF59 domain-containing protein [Candidatus Latescibacteria bacterium]|nr:DUF59 domain-containing protein [Candidatus Latescibacterota bacterium]
MGKDKREPGDLRHRILERLNGIQDPELKTDVLSLGLIRGLSVNEVPERHGMTCAI